MVMGDSWGAYPYGRLPQPREIRSSCDPRALLSFFDPEDMSPVPFMVLTRISQIGGDEAVEALHQAYEIADSTSFGLDAGERSKIYAVRMLGVVGGEKAKELLIAIARQRARSQGGGHEIMRERILEAAIEGLLAYWADDDAYALLDTLSRQPDSITATQALRAAAALHQFDMRRRGIRNPPEQVEFLLSRKTSPTLGRLDKYIEPGRLTYEAISSESVDLAILWGLGPAALPHVEDRVRRHGGEFPEWKRKEVALIIDNLHRLGTRQRLLEEELQQAVEVLTRPGMELVLERSDGHVTMRQVPTSARTDVPTPCESGESASSSEAPLP